MSDTHSQLLHTALEAVASASNLNDLKAVEVTYLGRAGQITELLKTLKDLSPEEKRTTGQAIQEMKIAFTAAYDARFLALQKAEIDAKLRSEFFDITLSEISPARALESGSIHPLVQTQQEIEQIFSVMGFMIADGPEVESEYYNFEALNIPAHHPARDMQDTFFLDQPTDPKHGHLFVRATSMCSLVLVFFSWIRVS